MIAMTKGYIKYVLVADSPAIKDTDWGLNNSIIQYSIHIMIVIVNPLIALFHSTFL